MIHRPEVIRNLTPMMKFRFSIQAVGSPRAAASEHLARHFFTADESKDETSRDVPWSHPCLGITDDLGGPLLECWKV